MTRKSTRLSDRGRTNVPFLLKPAGKDYLWGGSRLNDDFSKNIPMEPLAETWECSTHPDGPAAVVSGPFNNYLLTDVLRMHPEFLGTHPDTVGELPILIKLIDADNNLSVQVHPDDNYAKVHENGQLGKTEMWYVLDAAKDASIYYGLRHSMTRETLRKSIEDGTLERHLQKVRVRKDDVFYVEAGTIHAIGAGTLLAEIQENSNLTYRLYDYDRRGKDGRKRELHIEKALDVANLEEAGEPRQPMRVLQYRKGCATELLGRCKYFEVHRMLINTERCREMVSYRSDAGSFRVLLCVDGCGCISYARDAVAFEEEAANVAAFEDGGSEGGTANDAAFENGGCGGETANGSAFEDSGCGGETANGSAFEYSGCEGETAKAPARQAGYESGDEVLRFYKGDCIFVPANSVEIRIHGQAQFLDVRG